MGMLGIPGAEEEIDDEPVEIWKLCDEADPTTVICQGSEAQIRAAWRALVAVLANGGRFVLVDPTGHARIMVAATPLVVRGSEES